MPHVSVADICTILVSAPRRWPACSASARPRDRWKQERQSGSSVGIVTSSKKRLLRRSLRVFKECVARYWRKALGKRSQKGRMNWMTYRQLLTVFPLPKPAIHQAWLH